MSTKCSRVHRPYKTQYRVSNSAEYDQALIKRGSITFWFSPSAVKKWSAKPSGKRGGQAKYSDLANETALTLGLVFHRPLSQTEGFVSSIFELMGLQLNVADHSTLSRRSKTLSIKLRVPKTKALSISLSTVPVCPSWAITKGLAPNDPSATLQDLNRINRPVSRQNGGTDSAPKKSSTISTIQTNSENDWTPGLPPNTAREVTRAG